MDYGKKDLMKKRNRKSDTMASIRLARLNVSGCEKTTLNLESIRRANKEKTKYEILVTLILVFSQTDVSGEFTEESKKRQIN